MTSMTEKVDPVTQQVLEGAFSSICAEMGDVTIQSGNSSVLVDGRDFSCALLDEDCRLVAAANYDPSHLSAMAFTTEYAYMEFGVQNLLPGDVMIVNDPYRAGGHLPDMCVIKPLFREGVFFGSAIVRAHHIDVGGIAVSGFAGTAVSIFQEGLRIPPVHWFRAGVEQRDVMEMILLNVRFPQDQLGDFRAQLAATMRAEQRVLALCEKYGVATVTAAMGMTQDHSETLMRAVLGEIPDGRYEFVDLMDDDGVTSRPYKIAVAVTVDGSDVVVDFTGTSAQANGPINSSYTNTLSATLNAFLQIIGPDVHFNHGCFRPITLIAPRGSLVNPVNPAPVVGGVAETSVRIIDAIMGALAQTIPHKVCAAGYGTTQNTTGGGYDPALGKNVGFYFFLEGGWGATSWRDGWNSTPNQSGNYQDYPVEIIERTLPFECVSAGLFVGSGGAGKYRGGLGTERVFRLTCDGITISAMCDRHLHQPWGLMEGLPGARSSIEVKLPGDADYQDIATRFGHASPSKFANVPLPEDCLIRLRQGGGGGFGNPLERDVDAVLADLADGLITHESAVADYGVVVTESAQTVAECDFAATADLRASRKTAAPPAARHFNVASVDADFIARLADAKGADELDHATRSAIQRVEEFFERIDAQVAAGQIEPHLLDSKTSPICHPTAREFWDDLALRKWWSRHATAPDSL